MDTEDEILVLRLYKAAWLRRDPKSLAHNSNIRTIKSHEKDLLWFDLHKQVVDIVKDGQEDLVLRHAEVRVRVIR